MPRLFLCLVLSSLSLALSYYLSISISPSTYIYIPCSWCACFLTSCVISLLLLLYCRLPVSWGEVGGMILRCVISVFHKCVVFAWVRVQMYILSHNKKKRKPVYKNYYIIRSFFNSGFFFHALPEFPAYRTLSYSSVHIYNPQARIPSIASRTNVGRNNIGSISFILSFALIPAHIISYIT